ncbi:MAG: molecular chaperone HtpG, partial [Bacteroidales bacterium]|nr:molecular chaperone HtpG [Bacteroidales bacterium]
MQKGNIGVTSDNIFPIIKKFLYSDHEIFLRELVSNAVDATQKLKTLATAGEFKSELGDVTVKVAVDKDAKTITISDRGIGLNAEEIDKYINQIAFSGAEEFMDKYKDDANAIIGHFGLGFYSSFMVSEQVDIISKSWREGEQAVKWSCKGDPEFTLEEVEKAERGTDIVLHVDEENVSFLEDAKISELLNNYCNFLPIEISFGTKKEWKDGKDVETGEVNIINNPVPAWTKKPADLTEEDYTAFYKELYPTTEDPLFHIHLNVDFPFNLTGILYFPKVNNNIELQRNKIQLYSNQVFVTDSVEGIVPDFLTLLHGVIDSPDIPLNVSRSYLQSDGNVKKIAGHITKKVADRLLEIFKEDHKGLESKWDDLKMFTTYGILTEEKFYDRAKKFTLLKNTDGQYFTFDEYKDIIKENQTDKDKSLVYLYTTHAEEQFSYIEAAKAKGYDVLLMDGHLDSHYVNQLETKFENSRFVRVDSDIAERLIPKDDKLVMSLSADNSADLQVAFQSQVPTPADKNFSVQLEALAADAAPVMVTQNEFMRRMKDMQAMQGGGGGMDFYGQMPNSYSVVVNGNHPLILRIAKDKEAAKDEELKSFKEDIHNLEAKKAEISKGHEVKNEEEIPSAETDKL